MNTDKFPSFVRDALARRRRRRVDFILSQVNVAPGMRVLDVGCGFDGRSFEDYVPRDWQIVGVDIIAPEGVHHTHPNFSYLEQDARDLGRFSDDEFDLAVCVGMMEHITDPETFRAIVSEMLRVSKQFVVVVPYKYAWVEPHYGVPFFPLLPYSAKVWLVKALNLSGHREAVTQDREYINKHYRWLTNDEYQREYPGSTVTVLPTREMIAITKRAQL